MLKKDKDDIQNYRALWSAVIVQAFVDLKPKKFLSDQPKIRKSGNPAEDRRKLKELRVNRKRILRAHAAIRKEAFSWIFSPDRHPTSFLWACECLELDPLCLRKLALDDESIEKVLTGKSI